MKLVYIVCSLLSISLVGLCEEGNFRALLGTKTINKAFCTWDCLLKNHLTYCSNLSDLQDCECKTEQNVTDSHFVDDTLPTPLLVCKDKDKVGLYVDFIKDLVYIVELQAQEDDSWYYYETTPCNRFSLKNLKADNEYRVRVWGVSVSKKIYGPSEPTEWIQIGNRKNNFENAEIDNVGFDNFSMDEQNRIKTTFSWNSSEDLSCTYYLYSNGKSSTGSSCDYRMEIEYPKHSFEFTFEDIKMDGQCTVCVEAWNNTETITCIETPPCLKTLQSLDICAPSVPQLLNVTDELVQMGNSLDECFYDLTIVWEKPEYLPDYYVVAVDALTMNVSGNETFAVFSHVKFRSCYFVEITAFSNGGNSTSSNDVEISSPIINSNWKASIVLVVFGVVTFSFAVILVSFIVYRYFLFIKIKRQRLEATADFYEHRKSTSGVYTIAHIEQPIIEYSDKWELDADNLTIGQVLGEGAFGIVRKGYLQINSETIPVAIKMLKDYPNSSDLKEFQQEIEIMKTVGSHPHLVSLIGMCSWRRKNRPLLVVEFCAKGDLQSYLRSVWRKLNGHCIKIEDYKNLQYANNGEVSNKLYEMQDDLNGYILKPIDLLSFARQIALGMEYLSSLRLLHRDLAARNVLVCEDNSVKVADFGLSRDVYQDNIYCKSSGGKLPLKWMAIESLTHQQYTTQSDVWSYGILLWEIVTLGGFPYPDVATRDLLKYLESGCRMARPENCSMELYKLMRSCWEYNPNERPTFTEIVKYLDTLLENEIEYIKLGS